MMRQGRNYSKSKSTLAIIAGIALFSLMVNTLTACSSKKVKEKSVVETIHALPFDEIEIRSVADVYYTQDTTFSVKMYGAPKDLKKMDVKWEGNRLIIGTKENKVEKDFDEDEGIVVRLSSPDILRIYHKGVGDFHAEKPINTDTLRVEQESVGNIDIEQLVCDRLYVTHKGVGDFTAQNVKAQQAFLTAKGVGDVNVNFQRCDRVDARLYGLGDIDISGSVRNVYKTTRGMGDVNVSR